MTCFTFGNFNNLLLFVEQHIEQVREGIPGSRFLEGWVQPLTFVSSTTHTVWERTVGMHTPQHICCSLTIHRKVCPTHRKHHVLVKTPLLFAPCCVFRVREDMDLPTATLIGAHGYCTQVWHGWWASISDRKLSDSLSSSRSWWTCWCVVEPSLTSLTMTWNWTLDTETWLSSRESKATVTSACCPSLNIITSVRWEMKNRKCSSECGRSTNRFFHLVAFMCFYTIYLSLFWGGGLPEDASVSHLAAVQREPLQCAVWPAEGAIDQSGPVWPVLLWWTGQSAGGDPPDCL